MLINTTIYSCPICKQLLPASDEKNLKVMDGVLSCQCPKCGNYSIIQKELKCGYCNQKATQVKVSWSYNTRPKTYRHNFYCDEHAAQSSIELNKEIFLGIGLLGIFLNVLVFFVNHGDINGLCLGSTFLFLVLGAVGYYLKFSNTQKK